MGTKIHGVLAGTATLAALLVACGVDPKAHYTNKDYGQTNSGDAQPADPPVPPPAPAPAPAITPAPKPAAVKPPAPAPAAPTVTNDNPPGGDTPPLPPGTLLRNDWYRSAFDTNSAQGISNHDGYKQLGLIAGPKIKANLVTVPTDGVTITQTLGDGVTHSTVTQSLVSSAGDANRKAGTPSTSGDRRLDRVTGAGCPAPVLCAERMVITPKEGDPRTVCFADANGKAALFPYGALPNYKAADFTSALGSYGPFTVTSYPGSDIDCGNPVVTATATETLNVGVTAGDISKFALTLETVQPMVPQFAIDFANTRVKGDLVSPYIDETVDLYGKVEYVMNADAGVLTALVVTTRQSVDIAAQAGGGIIGSIANLLVGLDGVSVDLHFEMCKNNLDPKAVDHCPVPPPPAPKR